MADFNHLSTKDYVKKVCSKCQHFHNAGHGKESPISKTRNSWCCTLGRACIKAVGECKLNNKYSSMKEWIDNNDRH